MYCGLDLILVDFYFFVIYCVFEVLDYDVEVDFDVVGGELFVEVGVDDVVELLFEGFEI